MIKQIKVHLNKSVQTVLGQKVEFVKQDEQVFTRKRSLSLETMIRTILGMGGKSLSKELLYAKLTVSNSAFVQRRYQIKPAMCSSFNLPNTECFEQTFSLTLSRKQTNQFKKLYRDFPNDYHFILHNSTFDFLPETSRKHDPVELYQLPFRMVRLEVEEGKYETLVTNTDYSVQELKNLYASRWGIETSFRDLKYSIGLVNFHAKKKEGILQEIFARFINFNFCRWITSQVAIDSSHKKQRYKVCFSDAAYACRLFFNGSLSSLQLKNYLKKHLSIIRPNRKYPRKIKAQSVVDFIYRVT